MCYNQSIARVVKLVYTYALGAYAARRAGSSPVAGTRGDKDGSFESFFGE